MPQHRVDGAPADPRDRKHALGDNHAAQRQRDAQPDRRDDRHRSVLQRVSQQQTLAAHAARTRGADVILAEHLEHRRWVIRAISAM